MKRHPRSVAIAAILGLAVSACGSDSDSQSLAVSSVEFIGMPAPATAAEKADAYTTAKLRYNYSNGTSETIDLAYHTIFRTTDVVGGNMVGGLFDANDRPLTDNLGQIASDSPDGTSLLQIDGLAVPGATGKPLAMVTQFEYRELPPADGVSSGGFWSKLPAATGLALLDQDAKSGLLTAKSYQNVSFSGVYGGWQGGVKDAEGNQCVQDRICGPDNLRYVDSIRTLFIGEDTGRHNNNYVWAYNVDTKKLSRILSVPMAAEATGYIGSKTGTLPALQ
jgi:hypothetical protein